MACISTSASSSRMSGMSVELRPVELQVLARGEVAVAAVVGARDVGELAHLPRGQRAVGDGDAQHVGVQLQVDAVHQPQRLELVLGQLARDAALHLVAELRHALAHELRVELVVAVHGSGGLGESQRVLRQAQHGVGFVCALAGPRAERVEARLRAPHSPARRRGCWGRRRARARGSGPARGGRRPRAPRRDRARPPGCARHRRRRAPPAPATSSGERATTALVDALAPGALEIEEHDDAIAQAVGRQDGDALARLAHRHTSAQAIEFAARWRRSARGRRRCTVTDVRPLQARRRASRGRRRSRRGRRCRSCGDAIGQVAAAWSRPRARSSRVPFSTITTGVSGVGAGRQQVRRGSRGALPTPM